MTPVAELAPQLAFNPALAPQPAQKIAPEITLPEITLDAEREYEIVNGQPEVKEMASALHGGVTARLIVRLGGYVEANQLGGYYTPDTTFKIGKNNRLPDIGFVAAERFPEKGEPEGSWQIVPDLAIGMISPKDVWGKVNQKKREYFAAGVREVWLISLEGREAQLWTSPFTVKIVNETEELFSETLLPGFRCRLGDLFQLPVRRSAPTEA
jgi:Uma2 family endonuclease